MSDASNSTSGDQVKELFARAIELPALERRKLLDVECRNDAALRAAVESLLAAHESAGEFLAGPTLAAPGEPSTFQSQQVGPYKLLQVIGEGGFGTVYLAEQERPVRRRVALKIIKLGMDTRQVIARFEAERQALAMMDHPNIAKVFDAGATDSGRPYFVMELVKGEPITRFCDQHQLSIDVRLELFAQVCLAVQHAHQKGVIHRDIKPTNILVFEQDAHSVVKVIDFGIAKATQSRLTEKTLFTEFRQFIGTPEYQSPEQASGLLDIDTRTDVYSLGVLLYELLTGTTPFDPRDLRSKAIGEMQRVIREIDPPKPSTKLSTIEALPSVAAQRDTEPRKLASQVRGELDWIVMRCLEKDRTRRYESASTLAADVRNYLNDEPVQASPASAGYRFRKFVRRHRLGFAVALSIALALCAGLVIAIYGLKRARFERDQAIAARNQTTAALASEAEARAYEKEIDRFMNGIFEAIDPDQARGRDVLVKEVLAAASKRLDTNPPTHPVAEGSVRLIIGQTYNKLGLPSMALHDLQRAVALEAQVHPGNSYQSGQALNELAQTYLGSGQLTEAETNFRKSLEQFQGVLGKDHVTSLQIQRNLGGVLVAQQKLDDADALLTDLMTREKNSKVDPAEHVSTLNLLASLRSGRGRYAQAVPIAREAVETSGKISGDDATDTIILRNNLAECLRNNGQYAEAEAVGREAYEQAMKVMGPTHQITLRLANSQALRIHGAGKLAEASALYADTINRMKAALGEDNPRTLLTRSNAALVLQDQGRLEEALAEFRDVSARMRKASGEQDGNALIAESQVAVTLARMDRFAEAEPLMRDHLARGLKIFGAHQPATRSLMMRLGWVIDEQGRHTEAEPLLADAYADAVSTNASSVGLFAAKYGLCLRRLGKFEQAYPILIQAEQRLSEQPLPDFKAHATILDALIACSDQSGHSEDANRWRSKRQKIAQTQPASRPAAFGPADSTPPR